MNYVITESEKKEILGLHGLAPEINYLKEKLSECKFTKDGKFVLFENNVYSSETGELMPLTEKWTMSDTFHTMADIASMGLDFVFPGSGAVVDVLNAISYAIEAQYRTDPKEKVTLYVMGTITLAFVVVPGLLQSSIIPLKAAVKSGKGFGTPLVKAGLKIVSKSIDKIVLGVPRLINLALKSTLAKGLLGKFGFKKLTEII